MKIGDRCFVHGYIDEIRKDTVIVRNDGGYFGTILSEVITGELPSAQPERKMGKWIYNSPVTMKCDQCGFVIKDWDWHRFKFCPNCDCDMRGEQE